ncbi:MAG: hypothetical protein M1816_006707 [Peltula sp. TS41687]|nr:MAG: hypothetical protein M1816_006707 [Peltula sp. TS41687]
MRFRFMVMIIVCWLTTALATPVIEKRQVALPQPGGPQGGGPRDIIPWVQCLFDCVDEELGAKQNWPAILPSCRDDCGDRFPTGLHSVVVDFHNVLRKYGLSAAKNRLWEVMREGIMKPDYATAIPKLVVLWPYLLPLMMVAI